MKPDTLPSLPSVATERRALAVADIVPSPLNPRLVAVAERQSLKASLLEQGQIMPLMVRPHKDEPGKYELVDGERRWWGLQAAGIATATCDVGDFSDEHILRITWTAGTAGKPLSHIEQARWAENAMRATGATLEKVGALIGVPGNTLHRRLALLELPDFAVEAVQSGKLSPTTAYLIAGVPGAGPRAAFAQEVLKPLDVPGPLSFDDAEALRRAKYSRTLKGAPFDVADAQLVPRAGPCTTCRFRAGNNKEEYGEVKNPHTCMHTACYAEKEAAVRARLAAEEAGKIALSAEENERVFRDGSLLPSPESGYVLATKPIPPDLVKAEVAAEGAPTFAEVSPAARIFIGTAPGGHAVDLVRVAEAIAATTEPDIFRASVIAEYSLRDNRGGAHDSCDGERVEVPSMAEALPERAAPAPKAGSIAADEKRKARAEKQAERATAKKLRACQEWMLDLHGALVAEEKPEGYAYTLASLRWEHMLLSVGDADALLVLRALTEDEPAKGQTAKSCLAEYVAGLGGAEELQAVVDLLMIAPALRAQGVEAKWVTEWHRHLVLPIAERVPGAGPGPIELSAQEAGGAEPVVYEQTEAERAADAQVDALNALAEMPEGVSAEQIEAVKAEAYAGRFPHVIAYNTHLPEATVIAMLKALGLPATTEEEELAATKADVEALWQRTGTVKASAKDAMAKMACKRTLAELSTLEHWQALRERLQRIADAQARKQAKAAKVEAEG